MGAQGLIRCATERRCAPKRPPRPAKPIGPTAGYARAASAVTVVDDAQLRRDFPHVAAVGAFLEFGRTFGLDMPLEREVAGNGRPGLSGMAQKP
ncbi:hypothetical protein GCM10010836_51450 [Aminobacter aminovorans]